MSINGKHRPLTIEREAEIREELETAPVAIAGWYDSPRDEEVGNLQTTPFAVVEGGTASSPAWEVWYLDEVEGLGFDGAFGSLSEATEHANRCANETQVAGEEWLLAQKEADWEQRKPVPFTGTGPFTFRDNTDYRNGWELPDENAVLEFFKRNSGLLEPEEDYSIYQCDLVDSEGEHCWVVQSPSGEMFMESVDSDGQGS